MEGERGTQSRPLGQSRELDLLMKKRGEIFGRQMVHVYVSNYCEVLSSALPTDQVDQNKKGSNTMFLQRSRERYGGTEGLSESFSKIPKSVSSLLS